MARSGFVAESPNKLSLGLDFSNHYSRIRGSGVAQGAQKPRFTESSFKKFFKEGAAFLCPGDSGKPVAVAGALILSQRTGEYQFGNIGVSVRPQHAHKLGKDFFSLRI